MPPAVAIPPAYESTGYRRFIGYDGTEFPGHLAIELPAELSIVDEIATASRPARSRLEFVGVPGGSVPLTRVVNCTSPIRVNGGASATLATDITLSILPASGANAGSMSAAFFNFISNVLTAAVPTTITPDAAADAGASTTFASRADHTHAIAADIPGAIAVGDGAGEGTSSAFARADHRHSFAAPAAPQSVGAANSAGVSTSAAREDHVHEHAYNLVMGANTLTGTTTTRYLSPGMNTGTASANILDMAVTKAFKIDSMRYVARIGGTAGQTITATVRKNGAPVGTAVLTVASDATSGSSTFTAVSLAAGDTWGLQIDKSGAIASSPTDAQWTLGLTPP